MIDDAKILSSVPLLANLPPEEIEYLSSSLEIMVVPAGTVLIHEGQREDVFYIIRSGSVEVVKDLGTENERTLDEQGAGDFIGEMGLLNPDGLRTASVRSSTEVSLWKMARMDFDALMTRQPQIAYEMIKTLSWRLSNTQNDVINELKKKNLDLTIAYQELKAAQAQIIEKERLERELQVAKEIQMSILPETLPEIHGYSFGAMIEPARLVGGDFYDLIPLGEERIGILIGDVTDKGMPAAIFMARSHAFLRAEANRCLPPGETLVTVNQHLLEMNRRGLFVTVFYGILDGERATFHYARAGHELPVLIDAAGEKHILPMKPGQPLGIMPYPFLDEGSINLSAGDSVILYTDGVTDAQDPGGNMFREDGLLEASTFKPGMNAQEMCNQIFQRISEFRLDEPPVDDVTLVTVHKN